MKLCQPITTIGNMYNIELKTSVSVIEKKISVKRQSRVSLLLSTPVIQTTFRHVNLFYYQTIQTLHASN